jgi:hypothetical protein
VYLSGDAFLGFILGNVEIILALKAYPELRGRADVPGQSKRQFCADGAPSTDKQIHGGWGDRETLGNR